MTEELCACGRPLHYTSDDVRGAVEALISLLGPNIRVVVAGRTYLVPRHYIALHGLKGWEATRFPEAVDA